MAKTGYRKLAIPAFVVAVALGTGCATSEEISELRRMAQDAQQAATQASNAATNAQATADEASRKADDALGAAEQSNACCDATNEKIDRMFKRTMSK